MLRALGPGAIVTAAFIGPGTVTSATIAGARYGYTLLWALTFSTVATIVLQEMAARLGLVTGSGLGEAVRRRFDARWARLLSVSLIIAAIVLGNAAYQTGNLLGAGLGAQAVLGGGPRLWALVFGPLAFVVLWRGSYRLLERVLVGMVVVMSVVFLATAVVLAPAAGALLRGLFVPALPSGDALVVTVALIGTTVVPYNLFLHATAVRKKWSGPQSLGAARLDLGIAIGLGGVVSMAITVTAAAALQEGAVLAGAGDMAVQLEPLLGRWARVFFATGLLAAGLSSAITAPLAAAYASAGALGWPVDLRDGRLRAIWLLVLGAGFLFASMGIRPVPAILFAQVANGVILPGVALFLLLAVNDRRWMQRWANGPVLNLLGALVVAVTFLLGGWAILRAL
ncbi:MAG: Nramp family divalent metal transporter [Gemmatimonadetes bacterium]|nr:Nramp family divalent metal transporter [Gemmatimonadota bacterium]